MNFVADARLPGWCCWLGSLDHQGPPGPARAKPRRGARGDRNRRPGAGARYLPVEQRVVVRGGGGGVVWRRGQRHQRQQRLPGGLPAGQPREQRSGGGLGRCEQHGRGRDPSAQPEQPGRAGDHPNPGRRRRVCIHRPEERLPPPPLEPGAHQHPTSPRGRRRRGRRAGGRAGAGGAAGHSPGSGANSLGSAAPPLAPPLPRAESPSSRPPSSPPSAAAAQPPPPGPQPGPRPPRPQTPGPRLTACTPPGLGAPAPLDPGAGGAGGGAGG